MRPALLEATVLLDKHPGCRIARHVAVGVLENGAFIQLVYRGETEHAALTLSADDARQLADMLVRAADALQPPKLSRLAKRTARQATEQAKGARA